MQVGLHDRAVQAVARSQRADVDQAHHVVGEMHGGQSPVIVVEGEDGHRLAVKLVRMDRGELVTCPIAFPAQALNVFPVLDVFAWEDGYGLVMPLAELSLRQWLSSGDESHVTADLLGALVDVARALASIEGKMIHGDLKPENILRHESKWCLADFGPSACRSSGSQTGEYSLTPAYAAPEQWRGLPVTSRTDVYAFGVIAFELLSGVRPFPGPGVGDYKRQHLFQPAPPLIATPLPLAALIAGCLEKDPARRPAAARILAFFERGLGRLAVPVVPRAQVPAWENVPTLPLVI